MYRPSIASLGIAPGQSVLEFLIAGRGLAERRKRLSVTSPLMQRVVQVPEGHRVFREQPQRFAQLRDGVVVPPFKDQVHPADRAEQGIERVQGQGLCDLGSRFRGAVYDVEEI